MTTNRTLAIDVVGLRMSYGDLQGSQPGEGVDEVLEQTTGVTQA
jgi:hypothetical protein